MSKRALAWIVVALAGLLSTAGLLFFMFGTSKLTFSEAEVQERLNNKLPRTVRDMTIERMVARLAENRMALRVEVKGTVLRQPIAAVVTARGVPRYEAQKGEMFFDADDVKLGQLTVAGRSVAGEEDAATRKRLAEAASKAVQGLAQAAIKAYLASRPVYRFKEDFKGVVLKAALVDVAIQDNTLAVTFSLWRLSTMVAVFAFALFAVLLAALLLVRHPLWGLSRQSHKSRITEPRAIVPPKDVASAFAARTDLPAPHRREVGKDGCAFCIGKMGETRHLRTCAIGVRRLHEGSEMLGRPVLRDIARYVQLRGQLAADEIDGMAGCAMLHEQAEPTPRLLGCLVAGRGIAVAPVEGLHG